MEHRPLSPTGSPPRLHALDNLRALMMWLGIVLHVAAIHMVRPSPLPWRDGARTPAADLLMAFIHAFRMPVFFILAGFFVALLLAQRGPAGLARHRLLRLGLPFAVFWPPLFVACGTLALLFVHRMARGSWGLDITLLDATPAVPQGPSTLHLWFLWMLLWFSLLTAAAARLRGWPPLHAMAAAAAGLLQRLGHAWWGFAALALPLVAAGWGYPEGLLAPGGSFLPPAAEWLHNGVFFVFGLALFHQQWELFALLRRRWPAHAAGGLVLFMATGALLERQAHPGWIAFAYGCTSWLWSFALIGAALRWFGARRPALAYLADSAYWVYLVHMPLTIGFGALLFGTDASAGAKMAANIAATTVVCLASYHLLVRSTWVGLLLHGRRHARPPSPIPSHATPH